MLLLTSTDGLVTVHLDSVADLSGWDLRLSIVDGMVVDLQQPLVGNAATFTVPVSLIGKLYELVAISPTFVQQIATSGVTQAVESPGVQHVAFEPSTGGGGGGGGDFAYFVFDQMTPSGTWDIAHGLDRYPGVTVVDSAGTQVEGGVEYIDTNNVQLTFSAAFSGRALLGG